MTRAADLAKLIAGSSTLGGTGELVLKDVDTADGSSPKITFQTGDTDIAADDVLGTIDFQAPDEGTGTDAILVSAGVEAKAEGDFSSSSNATSLVLKTGSSEAAAEKVRLTSAGRLGVGTTSPQSNLHVTGTAKVATGNSQGILGLGEGNGTTVNVGLWRGDANNPTSDGNYLNLGGYEGIVFATGNAAIGSQTERMRIDANGHTTMPTQPAFLAEPSSTQSDLAINTANLPIVFASEIFDQNGDYDTSNSTFTAPVTGKYQLNLNVYFTNINSNYVYLYLQILTSNRNYSTEIQPQVFDSDGSFSMSVSHICDMDASDTAKVTCQFPNTGSAQTDVHPYSQFSGYLVC